MTTRCISDMDEENLSREHTIPPSTCPVCSYVMDRATGYDHEACPKPGDASICISCATLLTFCNDLSLRKMTDEDVKSTAPDVFDQLQEAQGHVQRFLLRRK